MEAGQSGLCSDRKFPFFLDNLVSTFDYDGLVSRVFRQQ